MRDRASPCGAHCTRGSTITAQAARLWRRTAFHIGERALCDIARRLTFAGLASIRRCHHVRMSNQRIVGVLEQRDVGHAERADGLAVITVPRQTNSRFSAWPLLRQKWKLISTRFRLPMRHRRRRMHGRVCAASGRADVREQDGGLVRATGEHRVFERVELIFQRCIDVRIRVTEEVDPPRADGIEVSMAVVS